MNGYDPYFIQTTFEIMQSELVLSNVIARINLNTEWGKKYFNGETLKTTETMEILKQRMQLAPVKNTKLIAITVYSDDKNEAAELANAIAEAYRDYRMESRRAVDGQRLARCWRNSSESRRSKSRPTRIMWINCGSSCTLPTRRIRPVPRRRWTRKPCRQIEAQKVEGERLYNEQLVQLQELKSIEQPTRTSCVMCCPRWFRTPRSVKCWANCTKPEQKWVTLTNDYSLTNFVVTRVQSLIDELNREIDAGWSASWPAWKAKSMPRRPPSTP